MKVVSFDVGIKNMAYCVFLADATGIGSEKLEILDWNVVDLVDATPPVHKACTATLKNRNPCGKKAKFQAPGKSDACFCDKHARECKYMLPTRERSPPHIKKLKLGELRALVLQLGVPETDSAEKRTVLIEKMTAYYLARCLIPITYAKSRADDCSIIHIGQRIKTLFNAIPAMQDVTHVLIENQISTVASRMSIIQGLLTQYFIMRHSDETHLVLEFISSKNKLKNFADKTLPTASTTVSQKYRQHKADSIVYAKQLLENKPDFRRWLPVLDTPKKDDLADCFLQGMWYLSKG